MHVECCIPRYVLNVSPVRESPVASVTPSVALTVSTTYDEVSACIVWIDMGLDVLDRFAIAIGISGSASP